MNSQSLLVIMLMLIIVGHHWYHDALSVWSRYGRSWWYVQLKQGDGISADRVKLCP
jgi:hypothetical protein